MNVELPVYIGNPRIIQAPEQEQPVSLGKIGLVTVCASAFCSAAVTASTYLGNTIMGATGHNEFDMPPYKDVLIPSLIGTSIVGGGLGIMAAIHLRCNR